MNDHIILFGVWIVCHQTFALIRLLQPPGVYYTPAWVKYIIHLKENSMAIVIVALDLYFFWYKLVSYRFTNIVSKFKKLITLTSFDFKYVAI